MANRFSFRKLLAWLYGAGESGPEPEILGQADVFDGFAATNRFAGVVIRAGAFEFLANTPLGEVRGRLTDPEREPGDGAPIEIEIPADRIRLDMTPPEENAFAGKVLSCVARDGRFAVRFATESGVVLKILATEAPPECEPDDVLYAWAFPEDVVGD